MLKPYSANVENMVAPTNASKWRMGFDSAFKGLIEHRETFHNERRNLNRNKTLFATCTHVDKIGSLVGDAEDARHLGCDSVWSAKSHRRYYVLTPECV
jgi:hypothetical protein